jgi:hypothetical protein
MLPRSSHSTSVIVALSLALSMVGTAQVRAADDEEQQARTMVRTASDRPARLRSLYISLAALQVLDVHSTKLALGSNAQARETNPIIASLGGSTAGMIALKASAAVSMYYMSEQLWKKNRKAAILTMIALNVGYGVVVANNYRVAAGGAPGR